MTISTVAKAKTNIKCRHLVVEKAQRSKENLKEERKKIKAQ